ncbi:hypothetical protein [Clostridium tagluense]|uniref:hypothetical protein n=1 Tax=Clostridium tagluense TaxID=360422 RepID=UPI001C0C1600|nr:hypothetical protein [Clostridium tagluense]MBU3130461.1 hypothetical protein [Clostridium tagluense]
MNVSSEVMIEMERLFNEYEELVEEKRKNGLLKESAASTYLLHSRNFIRWCKGDFMPGNRNINNGKKINIEDIPVSRQETLKKKI